MYEGGWFGYSRIRGFFLSALYLSLITKNRVNNQCILPIMTYGCKTWTQIVGLIHRLKVTLRTMERISNPIMHQTHRRGRTGYEAEVAMGWTRIS